MTDLKDRTAESWLCIDCGINTAPGLFNRVEMERAFAFEAAKARIEGRGEEEAGIDQRIGDNSEVYMVRGTVWKSAGMTDFGGCLCIACLEKRLGRTLKPKDFQRGHPFNNLPGTSRLLQRRGGVERA